MSLPGAHLHRVLAKWLSDRAVREIVEPTLADLQHEAEGAGWPRRWTATCRGYSDLLRALVLHGIEAGTPVRSATIILAIGFAGGAFYGWARGAVHDPRIIQSAFLLPMCLAPIALRFGGSGSSYRRTFVALIAVGLLMWAVSGGFVRTSFGAPWMNIAAAGSFNLVIVAICSALGAAAIWTPASGSMPLARRVVLGLFASALTTTAVYYLSVWATRTPERSWAVTLPFYAAMFAAPIVVTSLPVLFLAQRWIRTHLGLAAIGGLLSPAAMLVVLYLDTGSARDVVKCLRDAPSASALMTLPFTIGNGVLAWSLAKGRVRQPAR